MQYMCLLFYSCNNSCLFVMHSSLPGTKKLATNSSFITLTDVIMTCRYSYCVQVLIVWSFKLRKKKSVLKNGLSVMILMNVILNNVFYLVVSCFDIQGNLTYGKIGEWRFDKRSFDAVWPPKNLPLPPPGVPESVVCFHHILLLAF